MARKKNNAAGGVLVLLGFAVIVLMQVPKQVWALLGGIAVALLIGFIVFWNKAKSKQLAEENREQHRSDGGRKLARSGIANAFGGARAEPGIDFDSFRSVRPPSAEVQPLKSTSLSKNAGSASTARWIPFGEEVEVAGAQLAGGLIYVGSRLDAPVGGVDPCLIDPAKPVEKHGSYAQRDMGYWPSYSEISPAARRAYLNWLVGGRRAAEADVGYVFLFIYGLERRLIVDATLVSAEERQQIMAEVAALLDVYGGKSNSLRRYADALLDWVTLSQDHADLYKKPVPAFARSMELPFYMRLALGETAVDQVPVPVHLAVAWARLDPSIVLRTPAVRCAPEFDKLFAIKYEEAGGIQLPHNRSKLRLVYQPASGGFRGKTITLSFGDTPDITALTRPQQQLQSLVDKTTEALDSYSRALGKSAGAGPASELFLQLPVALWPEHAKNSLEQVQKRVGAGMMSMLSKDLQGVLGVESSLTRDKTLSLARTLEGFNIGMEPDVLAGARNPKPEDPVVLFLIPPGQGTTRDSGYQAAALTLELAAAVAAADGEFSAGEMALLRKQVLSWEHLSERSSRRLLAHLRLLMLAPVSLTSLKRKLEPLDASAKETLAVFMATVAASDGDVTPKEVKLLESVYKALNIDVTRVFSDVHAVVVHAEALAARRASPVELPAVTSDPVKVGSSSAAAAGPGAAPHIPVKVRISPANAEVAQSEPAARAPSVQPETPARELAVAKLDVAPIEPLRKDTERVSALLGSSFVEPAAQSAAASSATLSSDQAPPLPPSEPARRDSSSSPDDGLAQLVEGKEEPAFRIPAPPKEPEAEKIEAIAPAPEPKREPVPSGMREVAVPPIPPKPIEKPVAAPPAFKLDRAKIEALRKDTERVSALLGTIFAEEPVIEEVAAAEPDVDEPNDGVQARILGLDEEHTAFARMMLSRPQWTRAELQDLATDLKLMLDGALERVNEASFDVHDMPLTEGDDPVEVNPEVLEMIAA
ncbi:MULTISPECIES: TerB N-terminal domain-containing protein [unclassified Variovorax]|uniref:tellurite resistance TerB family protein n=1 Tax=unclassified Variovorax TaxID=663243 RepID=UPI00257629DD|nr:MULTISPECIES: TerB N-terminal domain-containing protein [unclassified Variovorax]MDM0091647.1 TerB N-terminal domain-containing protein [Variovorax sp. J22G40]MDM0146004.1 TerB N-terminal domain-containing protein [Variovorax sp. J2P1-31]